MRDGRFLGGIALLTLLGLAGCGGDQSGEQGPREVVSDFQASMLEKDPHRACELLTGEEARTFIADTDQGDEEKACPDAVERVIELAGGNELALLEGAHKRLDEATVRVRGGTATVDIPGEGSVFRLERAGGRWYIADTDADSALLPTAQELLACFEERGGFNMEIMNVADPGDKRTPLVLGIGPGGGRVGVMLSKNPLATEQIAAELANEFQTRPLAEDRAILISDGKGKDEKVAEACVNGS